MRKFLGVRGALRAAVSAAMWALAMSAGCADSGGDGPPEGAVVLPPATSPMGPGMLPGDAPTDDGLSGMSGDPAMDGVVPPPPPPPGDGLPPDDGIQPPIDDGTAGMGAMDDVPPPIVNTTRDPIIPAVTGACPNFATGDFSFQGLSGVMDVGPKGAGTGSLLFYWHGTGGSASGYRGLFGGIGAANIDKITTAGGIIVAVQGATGSGDATCSGTAVFDGDFTVIDQIVACAVQDHGIDPHRIYSTGCSTGGLQSGCMALRRSDYVAAVAPNSGGVVFPGSLMGSSGHVPASMTMHGGAGDNVGINFGDSSNTFNGIISGAGGYAIDCHHNSGHCGAPADLYSAAIDFLLAHPFGVDPVPYASGLPPGVPSYCQVQ